jgi:hypothetical protein
VCGFISAELGAGVGKGLFLVFIAFSRLFSMEFGVPTVLLSCFSLCAATATFSATAYASWLIGMDIDGYPADDIAEQRKRAEEEK